MNRLNIYKTHPEIVLPKYATKDSACFDISFQHYGKKTVEGYNNFNSAFTREMKNGNSIYIGSHERIKIPTGIIFDIPKNFSVRIHTRSSIAYKKGLMLVNNEGIIDSDYVDELFLLLYNCSDNGYLIETGERLAQGELVKKEEYALWQIFEAPTQKTDRIGGIGSTNS